LRHRLNATAALHVSPLSGPGDTIISAHWEYRTAFSDEAFPPDRPNYTEVEEFQETIRQGRQHPKIINLPPYPPADW
jgi:hypothetical protein